LNFKKPNPTDFAVVVPEAQIPAIIFITTVEGLLGALVTLVALTGQAN